MKEILKKESSPNQKIILALDGLSEVDAIDLVGNIPELLWVKVGLELFINGGPAIVETFLEMERNIFLDLKFHDIPATVYGACRRAANLGVGLLTVHASSGVKTIEAAVQGLLDGSTESGLPKPKLLAVTVLTCWDKENFNKELLIGQSIEDRVLFLAKLARDAGVDGCVCSPLEVAKLRLEFRDDFELVTPGIRMINDESNDQKRIMTPKMAILSGASKIVIGRPVTKSSNPRFVFEQICSQLRN